MKWFIHRGQQVQLLSVIHTSSKHWLRYSTHLYDLWSIWSSEFKYICNHSLLTACLPDLSILWAFICFYFYICTIKAKILALAFFVHQLVEANGLQCQDQTEHICCFTVAENEQRKTIKSWIAIISPNRNQIRQSSFLDFSMQFNCDDMMSFNKLLLSKLPILSQLSGRINKMWHVTLLSCHAWHNTWNTCCCTHIRYCVLEQWSPTA